MTGWRLSRGSRKARVARLTQIPAFAAVPDHVLADLDAHAVEVTIAAGRTLCVQGARVRQGYIVLSGAAAVTFEDHLIATYGPGDLVGAVALVDDLPASETVVALTELRVLVMAPSEFPLLFDHAAFAIWLARSLVTRVRLALEERVEVPVLVHVEEPAPLWSA